MKTEDFERLKKLCDENGFELVTESPKENDKFFVVKKKDEWDWVEFVRVRDNYKNSDYKAGKIYPLKGIDECGYFETIFDEDGDDWNGLSENEITPSTEQAYVEQLKKEAFERFGEIKEGTSINDLKGRIFNKWFDSIVFNYYKDSDSFYFQDCLIYQQGKWAERVKERISIKWEECDANYIKFSYFGSCNLIPRMNELSALLEKYLNNEL